MITFKQKGDFSLTSSFLKRITDKDYMKNLDEYGRRGVEALANATPKDTGLTASSWSYNIITPVLGSARIEWSNSNVNKGVPIAIIIQYGHGTGSGAYVEGVDYINPAMKSVFDNIANDIWDKVVRR